MSDFEDDLIEEKEFDIEKVGSYGIFSTSASYPIEYILTTFRAQELKDKLSFARDVRPEEIDFDLLIQRDIDEERVRSQIAPYLDPDMQGDGADASPIKRSVFFPPLLVAVVPVDNKKMSKYYQNETSYETGSKLIRQWGDQFKVTHPTTTSSVGVRVSSFNQHGAAYSKSVKSGTAKFECKKSVDQIPGIKLIVIDGQHRLKALQEVAEHNLEKISNLSVPVCLLFSPDSQERLEGKNLSIPEVFRQLFVDVNATAEQVGGHFRILLSDTNIGSLICRQFCSSLLAEDDGKERLAAFEWNTKSLKDSSNIVKKYSISSIGVIEKGLRELFKKRTSELYWWLSLKSVEAELYPEELERGSLDCPVVDWDTFVAFQRRILAKQVDDFAVPTLKKIYLESDPFQEIYSYFVEELDNLKGRLDDSVEAARRLYPAYEHIVEYAHISEESKANARIAKAEVKELGEKVYTKVQDNGLEVVRYALFQRAVFAYWHDLLQITQIYSCHPLVAADVTKIVLNVAFSKKHRDVFSSRQYYMQNSVYRGSAIITIDETRKALKNLLGSFALKDEAINQIEAAIHGKVNSPDDFIEAIKEYSYKCPSAFIASFERGFEKSFKRSFSVSDGLTSDQKDELAKAEQISKQHRKEYREKLRAKEDISNEFDTLVGSYVSNASERASADLRRDLSLDLDILSGEVDSEEDTEE